MTGRVLLWCVGLALLAACGSQDGTLVFGEVSAPCAVTVLTNDLEDDAKVAAGAGCFLGEFESGRPVVWDVLGVTVEGDSIPTRYEFDGEAVTITTDASRDEFGNGTITAQRCVGVQGGRWLPQGVECVTLNGEGFRSDSLPGG